MTRSGLGTLRSGSGPGLARVSVVEAAGGIGESSEAAWGGRPAPGAPWSVGPPGLRDACVPVVQAADMGNSEHRALGDGLDLSRVGRVAGERKVSS